jgi:hypothetical protein
VTIKIESVIIYILEVGTRNEQQLQAVLLYIYIYMWAAVARESMYCTYVYPRMGYTCIIINVTRHFGAHI